MSALRQSSIAGVFALPFWLLGAINVLVLKRNIYVELNDAGAGAFNGGLDWLSGHVWPTPYHPAIPFHELTGVIVWLAGVYPADLDGFEAWVWTFNALLVLLIGLWIAPSVHRLGLTYVDVLVVGLVAGAMPGVLIFSEQWTPFLPMGAAFAALSVRYVDFWRAPAPRRGEWLAVSVMTGFVAGFYFPALALLAPLGLLLVARLLRLDTREEARRWFGYADRGPGRVAWGMALLAVCIAGASVGTLQI